MCQHKEPNECLNEDFGMAIELRRGGGICKFWHTSWVWTAWFALKGVFCIVQQACDVSQDEQHARFFLG
jgi:hypothetical protein